MVGGILKHLLPAGELRGAKELAESLDVSRGSGQAKQSAFWTMLLLSAVIAACGVLTDSTATVIGAMIIAPLSTPIMGIALGVVRQRRTRAVWTVIFGGLLVISVGALAAAVVPSSYDLVQNSQIAGRTSPGIVDLVAALATGAAGAVGLARRDVAAVLPGVAIAISLVPPLVVAGVCLGQGVLGLAAGALVLFLSNLLALVFAGMVVFAASGYGAPSRATGERALRRARLVLAVLFTVVFVPLVANTTATVAIEVWTGRAEEAADRWIADQPNAEVTDVFLASRAIHVQVRVPDAPPVPDVLVEDLRGRVPGGFVLVVETTQGVRIDAGAIGS